MADDVVTDLEIAVLCDLLDGPGVNLKAHRRSVLDALVSKGLVEPAKDEPERFQLTDKAHHLLGRTGRGNKRRLILSMAVFVGDDFSEDQKANSADAGHFRPVVIARN
jgi:hypothetical protein